MKVLGVLSLMMSMLPPEPEPPDLIDRGTGAWNPKHKIGKAKKEALDKRRKAAKKASRARRRNKA